MIYRSSPQPPLRRHGRIVTTLELHAAVVAASFLEARPCRAQLDFLAARIVTRLGTTAQAADFTMARVIAGASLVAIRPTSVVIVPTRRVAVVSRATAIDWCCSASSSLRY